MGPQFMSIESWGKLCPMPIPQMFSRFSTMFKHLRSLWGTSLGIAQLHCQRCSAIDAAAENAIGGKGGSKSHGTVQMCPTCFWNLLDMLLEFCEHHVVVPCLQRTRYSKKEYHHLAHASSPVTRLFQSDHKWPKRRRGQLPTTAL
jgi:hypothetical protein